MGPLKKSRFLELATLSLAEVFYTKVFDIDKTRVPVSRTGQTSFFSEGFHGGFFLDSLCGFSFH